MLVIRITAITLENNSARTIAQFRPSKVGVNFGFISPDWLQTTNRKISVDISGKDVLRFEDILVESEWLLSAPKLFSE